MSATPEEAADQIVALFKATWDVNVTSSPVPVVYWDNAGDKPETPDAEEKPPPYVQFFVKHLDGRDEVLGGRKQRMVGRITLQIFVGFGVGHTLGHRLAKIAMDAFRRKETTGGVWFRNVHMNEVGRDGNAFRIDVLVDFTYTDLSA